MTAPDLAWRCVWRAETLLGEGPIYDRRDNALYFVDIKRPRLNRFALDQNRCSSWEMPEPIGWVAPRANEKGFVAGFKSGFALLDLDPFAITAIGAPEPERPGNRLNDAKVDHQGRLWAGSMDDDERAQSGALYRLDADFSWRRMDDGYGVANGPAFSPAGDILYHADSAKRIIYSFALSADGALGPRRTFVQFPDDWGYPDGMTTDAQGGLWVAHWDGGRISRFHPDGALDRSIALPVSRPTSCAFASDRLERLFVTSARLGCEHEPLAGGLFELDVGATGSAVAAFAG
ncbi:MAG: SMP-30/gluconolactonase/LRE family protein [Terricaulis sp.]